MDYTILSRTKAKEFKSLSNKKERERQRLFLVEGEKAVVDTWKGFEIENIIINRDWLEKNQERVSFPDDKILLADKRGMEIISSFSSLPEVIGIFKIPKNTFHLRDIDNKKLYLLLDEIQDPGNLGTIIRTCDWFGIYDIFASPDTADCFNPKVVQGTMGSLSRVRVHYLNLKELIEAHPSMPVIGTLLEGESLYGSHLPQNGFLLMGNEGRGISESLKQKIDKAITIPPANQVSHPDSLNVAIATAILLSHMVK